MSTRSSDVTDMSLVKYFSFELVNIFLLLLVTKSDIELKKSQQYRLGFSI